MRSTFFGLEIGRRALQSQQRALDVTGHNIANANTAGYTRQEAVLVASDPYPALSLNRLLGSGQIGTGVEISEIRRLRDGFLDLQVRHESKALGYWEARRDALQNIEVIFTEPSDNGLQAVFEKFWESLQDLSSTPESLAARSVVRQMGIALAETFNHMDRQLSDLQKTLDSTVEVKVNEVNSIARQIADLNEQILKIEVTGSRANDLRDKRDLLMDQLAKLVSIRVSEDERGLAQINIGGRPLVQGVNFSGLVVRDDGINDGFKGIYWESDMQPVEIDGGTIRGLIEMRGYVEGAEKKGLIREMRKSLDNLAAALVENFNKLHAAGAGLDGSTGVKFFKDQDDLGTEVTAANISLSDGIMEDLNKIAAASRISISPDEVGNYDNVKQLADGTYYTWDKGDSSNAVLLAGIKSKKIMMMPGSSEPSGTFEDYYQAVIGELGVYSQEAGRMTENQQLLVSQLENNRQSVSGVSLDEEMVNMVRFQHAYSAAARLISTMDELLDIIINKMGLVGR